MVDATEEDDTPEQLLVKPFRLPEGGSIDLRTAPIVDVKALARALRQQRAATNEPARGFSTTPADRKTFAALIAPVAKDKTLGGVATFKLLASREEHGPLVESRVPLKDYPRVVALLHTRR